MSPSLPPPSPASRRPVVDDRPLLARARSGQSAAFNDLYRRHVRPVYWQAYAVVGNAHDAEDATQDVFITAWKKLGSIEIVGESLLPWLLVTARYTALNKKRLATRRGNVIELDPTIADRSPSTEELLEAEMVREHVSDSIAQLGDTDRDLYELCINGDHTYAEAAAELGVTHGAVRNRVSRIRKRLRSDLDFVKESS